jgi:capsular polysaccharide biosynthesis protein
VKVTHRLQDAFGLANFRFDPETTRVVPVGHGQPGASSNHVGATRFLVLRDGRAYFEGDQHDILHSTDSYLKGFLL